MRRVPAAVEYNATYDELAELLANYGHPEVRVPLNSMMFGNKTPWEVGVVIIFDDRPVPGFVNSTEWRKNIVERLDALLKQLRRIGWVVHGRVSLRLDFDYSPPICTLENFMVQLGEERELGAEASFALIPINGELVNGET